jgi:DNA excision repair protein ERCC-4
MRSLKNERDCFEGLIDHKSRMVLNEDSRSSTAVASRPEPNTKSKQLYAALRKQAGDVDIGADDGEGLSYSEERISNSSSRSGGQKVVTRERIIVDIREFMSNLPAYLYSHDFELIPVTLLVGDFILSLYICIERKSLPDLIQSFASGRLYNQMMQMRRCYKQPVLMIEFSKDKRFFLQPVSDIRRQISSKDLISKLCLLMLHFPEMQVLWSRNPHHTAALFKMLKMNRSQPVLNNEYMAGLQDEDAAIAQQGEHDLNTMTPYDMLRKIPGVHDGNVRKLLNHIDTLQDLANATEQDMCTWLGNINGQACFRFVNEDVGTFFV